MLVIPIPRKGKNYVTIKDFVDNAPKKQQKEFWKTVSQTIQEQMKIHDKIWVSVHGLGVAYLHVRISRKPKYYFSRTNNYV